MGDNTMSTAISEAVGKIHAEMDDWRFNTLEDIRDRFRSEVERVEINFESVLDKHFGTVHTITAAIYAEALKFFAENLIINLYIDHRQPDGIGADIHIDCIGYGEGPEALFELIKSKTKVIAQHSGATLDEMSGEEERDLLVSRLTKFLNKEFGIDATQSDPASSYVADLERIAALASRNAQLEREVRDLTWEKRAEGARFREALEPLLQRARAPGADKVPSDGTVTVFMSDCRRAAEAAGE